MIAATLMLARPEVRELVPYSSARSLSTEGEIFLDANESPWGPFDGDDALELNRYPEPQPEALLAKLSNLYGVPNSSLFMGRGADDAIDALVRTFCAAGKDSILICPPTYGVYEVAARIQGATVRRVPVQMENGFEVDPDAVLSAWASGTKLVFLCSPNNPTGNLIPPSSIERICRGLEGRAVVVLDEAYVEFAREESFCERMGDFPNLVVLRTLSKAWALAGARCGVAIAHPAVIELLQKVRAPYPLSAPSLKVALKGLSAEGVAAAGERVSRILKSRGELARQLSLLPQVERVFPSEANFILVKVKSGQAFLAACRSRGIVVRDRSRDAGLMDCVRISVGSEIENQTLLDALRSEGVMRGS